VTGVTAANVARANARHMHAGPQRREGAGFVLAVSA